VARETDMLQEDEIEGGSEIYYTDENGNTRSREFLSQELVSDQSKVEG
jgi:hypothetical protein